MRESELKRERKVRVGGYQNLHAAFVVSIQFATEPTQLVH